MFFGFVYSWCPMSKTKKTNPILWIIKNNQTGKFLNRDSRYDYTDKISNAKILASRKQARMAKVENESVYKIRKTKNGIQLIGPEWM